jgi:hypothetical protein
MNGQHAIYALRDKKLRPAFIFINDWPCKTDWFEFDDHATVCTAGDDIGTLDMRFCKGTAVSVSSEQESRAKALFEAVKQAGATVVAAHHVKNDQHWSKQTGWMEIYRG